jgi:hypothetical protein
MTGFVTGMTGFVTGHDFSRADTVDQSNGALAPEGMASVRIRASLKMDGNGGIDDENGNH